MARIRCRCASCGVAVDLEPVRLTLNLPREDDSLPATYAFVCSLCGTITVRRADDEVAALLTRNGVSVAGGTAPARPRPHPEAPPAGPVLDEADAAAFADLLVDDARLRGSLEEVQREIGR